MLDDGVVRTIGVFSGAGGKTDFFVCRATQWISVSHRQRKRQVVYWAICEMFVDGVIRHVSGLIPEPDWIKSKRPLSDVSEELYERIVKRAQVLDNARRQEGREESGEEAAKQQP